MRTIQTDVFQFDELSEKAKEKARDWYRSGDTYAWQEENRASLDAFCAVFPVQVRDWSYDAYDFDIRHSVTCDEEVAELTGPRLVAYLANNFGHVFSERKTYRVRDRVRKSRAMQVSTDCPFTGYCMDESLLDPLRAFLKKPGLTTFGDMLTDCLDAWGKACRDDCAWQATDENVDESIRANEYEFTEEGERF